MADPQSLFELGVLHPGKHLARMMDEKGWSRDDVANVTGLSGQLIYLILSGKNGITLETAVRLAAAFGNSPEEWVKWDSQFKLASMESDVSNVGRMARLYAIAPIREMQRRGWIKLTVDPSELESELTKFYGNNPLDGAVTLPIAAKRTIVLPNLNPSENAWCFRAHQLAQLVPVSRFSPNKLDAAEKKLRQLAAHPKEARHVPKVLADCGIRFVVIEPLPDAQIDGATLWFDGQPIIAVSLRHDRIDGFWFTLMHEFAHVRNNDGSVDTELVDGIKGIAVRLVEDEAENVANDAAANSLIPKAEMTSFIRRVGPFYPKERVVQFANKMKIHPGIIVGQLQHRDEIGYGSLREFLVKVRDFVTTTALTDGWNQTVAPSSL